MWAVRVRHKRKRGTTMKTLKLIKELAVAALIGLCVTGAVACAATGMVWPAVGFASAAVNIWMCS